METNFSLAVLSFLSIFLTVQGQTTFYDVTNKTASSRFNRRDRYLVFPPRLSKPNPYTYRPTVSTTTSTTTTTVRPSTRPPIEEKDILDISSSEYNPSLAWPVVPRRSGSRLFRPPVVTTTTMRPLVKLQRPRPTRPALYSLDGFVPTPAVNYIYSTEANPAYNYNYMHGRNDLQSLGTFTKPRKVKLPNSAENEEKRNSSKSGRFGNGNRSRKKSNGYTSFSKASTNQHFPTYETIPKTDFDCTVHSSAGMYADPEAGCQVWHMCPGGNLHQRHSFLCPHGTIFSEAKGICDWWYNVICQEPDRRGRR